MPQVDVKKDIGNLKCEVYQRIYIASNLADMYILLNQLTHRVKPRLDEYIDAHLITGTEASEHIQEVYTTLHNKCREIVKSSRLNN